MNGSARVRTSVRPFSLLLGAALGGLLCVGCLWAGCHWVETSGMFQACSLAQDDAHPELHALAQADQTFLNEQSSDETRDAFNNLRIAISVAEARWPQSDPAALKKRETADSIVSWKNRSSLRDLNIRLQV